MTARTASPSSGPQRPGAERRATTCSAMPTVTASVTLCEHNGRVGLTIPALVGTLTSTHCGTTGPLYRWGRQLPPPLASSAGASLRSGDGTTNRGPHWATVILADLHDR